MRLISVVSIVFLSIACAPSPGTSDLSHTLGRTSRQPKTVFKACSVETTNNAVLQAAERYINDIAQFIMTRNPSTFSGVYAPANFCFAVRADAAVNASARPDQRKVTFYTGMLETMANDGQVAAVMAHELAHVTMQHFGVDESETIANDSRWQANGPALKQKLLTLAGQRASLESRQEAMWTEQSSLEAELDASEMDDTRAMRLKLDGIYDTLNSQIYSTIYKSNGSDAFTDMLALSKMLLPPTPRMVFEDGSTTERGSSSSTEYATLRVSIERYLSERNSWIAAERKSALSIWQKYSELASRASVLNKQYAALLAEADATNAKLDNLRKAIAGEGANNLEEKEADEVGLELYLRAGFAPLNFLGMFEVLNLSEQQEAASCVLQNESKTPNRGDGTHPAACWRYYNAKVLEMSEHGDEYATLINKAVATEIIPGGLDRIKKALAQPSR